MRSFCIAIVVASTSALAAPGPQAPTPAQAPTTAPTSAPPPVPAPLPMSLSTIVVEDLPIACRELGTSASSRLPAQALSARISLASCLVEQKLKSLVLCDCEQSVNELESAAAPSLALFDEVFSLGDTTNKILARHAQGDLLQSFATRILATVPAPLDSSPASIALRETRLGLITPLVTPWIVRAQFAYTDVDRLARANPHLAKNQVVLMAVKSSRAKLAQSPGVAKR